MQHMREILAEIEKEMETHGDRDSQPSFNSSYYGGVWVGLNKSKTIILRKIAELEEKGECEDD